MVPSRRFGLQLPRIIGHKKGLKSLKDLKDLKTLKALIQVWGIHCKCFQGSRPKGFRDILHQSCPELKNGYKMFPFRRFWLQLKVIKGS